MTSLRVAFVAAISSLVAPAAAQTPAPVPTHQIQAACAADRERLCGGVEPGGGRIAQCFRRNAARLSTGCREAILAARRGR
jgi:sugar (pentulose or hexulose) kinase